MVPYLTLLIIALISSITAADDDWNKPGTVGKPKSMYEEGADSVQVYLRRSHVTKESKDGVRGHFYARFMIGNGLSASTYSM